jgi:DNA-binding IclR family transcriptional regulator
MSGLADAAVAPAVCTAARDVSACIVVPVRAPAGALVAALAMSGRAEQDLLLQRQIPTLVGCSTRLSPLLA